MIVTDKLDELCKLLAQHVQIGDARKRAGITDKQYEKLLDDPKVRTRIEAAQCASPREALIRFTRAKRRRTGNAVGG